MRFVGLPALVVGFAMSSAALGVCLHDDYSVEAEYSRSVAVVIAEVVSERNVPDPGDDKSYGGVSYRLTITESFRGSLEETLDVFSENSTGRFPMERGKTYVLFLHKEQGRLSADNCGNSGLAAQKHDVIATLRTITKVDRANAEPIDYDSLPDSSAAFLQSGLDLGIKYFPRGVFHPDPEHDTFSANLLAYGFARQREPPLEAPDPGQEVFRILYGDHQDTQIVIVRITLAPDHSQLTLRYLACEEERLRVEKALTATEVQQFKNVTGQIAFWSRDSPSQAPEPPFTPFWPWYPSMVEGRKGTSYQILRHRNDPELLDYQRLLDVAMLLTGASDDLEAEWKKFCRPRPN